MNLKKKYIDKRTGIEYTLVGDVYLPFYSEKEDPEEVHVGIWGMRHRDYLKEHKPNVYRGLLFSGRLGAYLADVDKRAEEMCRLLTRQIAQAEHITEQLKAEEQMAWIGAMNNIAARVREIVFREVIYQ